MRELDERRTPEGSQPGTETTLSTSKPAGKTSAPPSPAPFAKLTSREKQRLLRHSYRPTHRVK
jgi:hypothetical protein